LITNFILEISEIGIPVDNIQRAHKLLSLHGELDIYDGGFQRFCAIGDAHGLFICIDKNVKDWFPTHDIAFSSDFKLIFESKQQKYELLFLSETLNYNKVDSRN
jgi:hypothetical protein